MGLPRLYDRIRDTSTTTGTGTFTVSGTPPTKYHTFSDRYLVNDQVPYLIVSRVLAEWEVGQGTYLGGNQIRRDTAIDGSSGTGVKVNFSAGTKDVLVVAPSTMAGNGVLTGSATYWVSNAGSDSNNGLSQGSAFLTLQHAFDFIGSNIFIQNGFPIVIQVADGTYSGATISLLPKGDSSGGKFILRGNLAAGTNVTINNTASAQGSNNCINQFAGHPFFQMQFFQMAIATDNGIGWLCNVEGGSLIEFDNITWINNGSGPAWSPISANLDGCQVNVVNGTLTGGKAWNSIIELSGASQGNFTGAFALANGTPSFATASIYILNDFALQLGVPGGAPLTFSGSATGLKFFLAFGGEINIDGTGDFNFIPGNAAGQVRDYGIYDGLVLQKTFTFATLPTAPLINTRTFISDGSVVALGNFGTIAAGGGSNKVPVYYDGTNWRIGG